MKIFLECATCDVDGNGDGDNLAAPAATNLQLQQAAKKIINKAKWKRIMRKRLFSILLQFIATRRERQREGEIVIHLLVNKLWQAAARMRIRRVQRTWARATRKNAEMFNWKTFVIKLLKLCAHKARQRGKRAGEREGSAGGKLHQNYLLINLRQKLWQSDSDSDLDLELNFVSVPAEWTMPKLFIYSLLFHLMCFIYFVLFHFVLVDILYFILFVF